VAAATGLEAVAGCGDGTGGQVADFKWHPADPPGDTQRLILSYTEEGLHHHDLILTGELGPGRSTYHWVGLAPGTDLRYWAVVTFANGTSQASEDGTFPGVACPADPSSSG
jgi:hypothetical protein